MEYTRTVLTPQRDSIERFDGYQVRTITEDTEVNDFLHKIWLFIILLPLSPIWFFVTLQKIKKAKRVGLAPFQAMKKLKFFNILFLIVSIIEIAMWIVGVVMLGFLGILAIAVLLIVMFL